MGSCFYSSCYNFCYSKNYICKEHVFFFNSKYLENVCKEDPLVVRPLDS